ncbi:MAG TPA: hypothetical protein VL588_08315 [Bdellovibrionota bacterium]|jgi:hypothetical protein|nr:hypothetical protein [Bdellovibrionota bacterium]
MNKNQKKAAALLALGLAVLSGCGGSSPPPSMFGGIPGSSTGGLPLGSGGCIPIQSPIGFSGQNIHFDTYNLVGGNLPPIDYWPTKVEGMVAVGGGGVSGVSGSLPMQGSGFDGSLQINVLMPQQQPYGTQPYGTTQPYPYTQPTYGYNSYPTGRANVQGTLSISPTTQYEIMQSQLQSSGYTYGMPVPGTYSGTPYTNVTQPMGVQQACVSGVAFNMGYQVNRPYGKFYIYLNGTGHGFTLGF